MRRAASPCGSPRTSASSVTRSATTCERLAMCSSAWGRTTRSPLEISQRSPRTSWSTRRCRSQASRGRSSRERGRTVPSALVLSTGGGNGRTASRGRCVAGRTQRTAACSCGSTIHFWSAPAASSPEAHACPSGMPSWHRTPSRTSLIRPRRMFRRSSSARFRASKR